MATVLLSISTNAFYGRKVRHLNPAFAPVLLTKNGPLGAHVHVNKTETSYPLKVEIVSPPSPLIIRFTGYNHAPLLQLSWGKLRREPATRRLSPLYPSLSIDLHVRTDTDFHQSFLCSPSFGSQTIRSTAQTRQGQWCAAPKSGSHVNRLTGFSPPLDSRINYTPRSVFQDGSERWLTFTLTPKGIGFTLIMTNLPESKTPQSGQHYTVRKAQSTQSVQQQVASTPLEPQLSDFRGYSYQVMLTLSGSTSAISRSLELSLQSSLQLSLTVLVCYRFRVDIYLSPTLGLTIPTILLSVQVSHPLWMLAPIKETSEMQYSRTVTPIRYSSQRPKTERFS
uniref:Ig-like domain-containing protein n=1 Tax=Heterorhabditis bacteriophora TaxID=37862 RepID=A0A1I7WKT8_HETBA